MKARTRGHFFQGLIFDLYGTLVQIFHHAEYAENLHAIVDALDLEADRFLDAWSRSWEDFPFGEYPSVRVRFLNALAKYHGSETFSIPPRLDEAVTLRFEYIRQQNLRIKDGALDALAWARSESYKLGLISNCSIETADSWQDNPLSEYIPNPTLSCIVKMKKPDPAIFLAEMNRMGVNDPRRCIYVADGDDHEFDTARELGMETILVQYDPEDAYRHEPFPDDIPRVIEHFADLPLSVREIEEATKAREA